MNGIGYLVYKGVIDVESVYDYGGGRPIGTYRKFKSSFEESKTRRGYDRMKWLKYLYDEMRKLSEKRGDNFLGLK